MATVRIAAAQTPEFRGNMGETLVYAARAIKQASVEGARLLCFPECFLQGYLLEEAEARRFAVDLASSVFQSTLARLPATDMVIVFGLIEANAGRLFNSAVVVQNGLVKGVYRKTHLLKVESFFTPGAEMPVFSADGLTFGVTICHDTNAPALAKAIADQGGRLIVCPANNMMPRSRAEQFRHQHNAVRAERCREQGIWLVSSDIFGMRDGRIALGPTAVIDPYGRVVAQLPLEQEGMLIYDIPVEAQRS